MLLLLQARLVSWVIGDVFGPMIRPFIASQAHSRFSDNPLGPCFHAVDLQSKIPMVLAVNLPLGFKPLTIIYQYWLLPYTYNIECPNDSSAFDINLYRPEES